MPTRGEVQMEGFNPDIDTYRKVAHKVALSYFASAGLTLAPLEDELFQVAPIPGNDWPDVAFYLAHEANLEAGAVTIHSAQELLKRNAPQGRPWPDYESAVLANLDIIRDAPEALRMGSGRETMLKAFELIKKGPAELLAEELAEEAKGQTKH
ncbi:MAG: hypothetical protein KQH53_08090 [Desulfarculaceae bacterium]|nr:hypothetical protein [Desulfarculaceae bacterium]